jgi:hypothetical protein
VPGAVNSAQDKELRIAGDDAAAEDAGSGEHRRLAVDPAGELFPQHGGAHLGPDRGQGPLPGLPAQPASNSASSSSNTRRIAGEVDSSDPSGSYMPGSLVLGRLVHNFAGRCRGSGPLLENNGNWRQMGLSEG